MKRENEEKNKVVKPHNELAAVCGILVNLDITDFIGFTKVARY